MDMIQGKEAGQADLPQRDKAGLMGAAQEKEAGQAELPQREVGERVDEAGQADMEKEGPRLETPASPHKMTHEEALEEIHSLGRFGSKLGLSRMKGLMELLGNPQENMKVIHVAGTNGKGSVCRYIYSILEEQGYKTGLYTSPFLEVFNERIEFHGACISDEDLAECTAAVMDAVREMTDGGRESPTEFEVVTAIAFVYFSRKPMDYLVLEVGLGGRGDSTNVVEKPLVTVITSISYDHMDYLGDTLEAIAWEKAGILKCGCPVVFSIKDEGAAGKVMEEAEAKGCPAFDVLGTVQTACVKKPENVEKALSGYRFDAWVFGESYPGIALSMPGMHQVENALCALSVVETLKKGNQIRIDRAAVYEGLRRARQIGRFEILGREPWVIIDGAHNDDGAKALAKVVKENFKGKRILLVCGILADKEADKMIEAFGGMGADLAATEPDNPRKLPSGEFCRRIRAAGYPCDDAGDYRQAVEYGKQRMADYDLILYAGSLYLIGKIREGFGVEN